MNSYLNFRLELADYQSEGERESLSVRVTKSRAGQQRPKEATTVEISPSLRQRQKDLELRGLDEAELIAFGEDLAKLLFPPAVRNFYVRSRAVLKEQEGLRIQICADTPEIGDLPWEYTYLWDPAKADAPAWQGFLALDRKVSLVRYEELPEPEASMGVDEIRVAALLSDGRGSGHPILDMDAEDSTLRQALIGVNGVDLETLRPGKLQQLQDLLTTRGAQVFHFAGHGKIEEVPLDEAFKFKETRYLVLSGDDGAAFSWEAEKAASLLGKRGIRLAVLAACDSGGRDPKTHWSGVASALVQQGIPAVIGMQYTVRDANAIAFSHQFYQALASGKSIDTAVSEGRHAIFQRPIEGGRDWGVPVLYLRTDNSVLFPKPVRPLVLNLGLSLLASVILMYWFFAHIYPKWFQLWVELRHFIGFGVGAAPAFLAFLKLLGSKALSTVPQREQDSRLERMLRNPRARSWLIGACGVAAMLLFSTQSVYLENPAAIEYAEIAVSKGDATGLPELATKTGESHMGGPIFFRRPWGRIELDVIAPRHWEIVGKHVISKDNGRKSIEPSPLYSINLRLDFPSRRVLRLIPINSIFQILPSKNETPHVTYELSGSAGGQALNPIKDLRDGVIWVGEGTEGFLESVANNEGDDERNAALETCLGQNWRLGIPDNARYYYRGTEELQASETIKIELKDNSGSQILAFDSVASSVPAGGITTQCLRLEPSDP